jgi:hypothetical protein
MAMAFSPDLLNPPLALALLLLLLPLSLAIVWSAYRKRKRQNPGPRQSGLGSLDDLAVTQGSEATEGEIDVIIVGAGVAGAALAHTLGKVFLAGSHNPKFCSFALRICTA